MQEAKVNPGKFLVVDDDEDMVAFVRKAITDLKPGTEVHTAISLEEAFTILVKNTTIRERKPFQLIVADIMLEGQGTGLDLWRVLCGTYPDIPILVISSLPEEKVSGTLYEEERERLIYLRKPFTAAALQEKISAILESVEKKMKAAAANHKEPATESKLLNSDRMHRHMAQLLILKMSMDWLVQQEWVDTPYGGQNQVQDILYQTRFLTNKFWEEFFFKNENEMIMKDTKIKEQIMQMSDLTPELKEFFQNRLNAMDAFFLPH